MTTREALIVIAFVGILIYVLGTTYDALALRLQAEWLVAVGIKA